MKNKFLVILSLVLSVLMLLASCDEVPGGEIGGDGSGCAHTFAEGWATDATNHWHAATCEHGEVKDSLAEHVDADEDGKCDVCAYEVGHTHAYAAEWSSDETNHWKTATCTHTDEKVELGLHADDDQNGECDACAAHVHVLNANGKCTVCDVQVKPVDPSNLASLIGAVTGAYTKVNGGKITSNFVGRYNNSAQLTKKNSVVEYLYGNGSAYYKIADAVEVKSTDREGTYYEASTSNLIEKWINTEANGEIYAVYRETASGVTGDFNKDMSNANTLWGYFYSVSTLANGYGAEGILAALFEKSQAQGASDFTYEIVDGTCNLSFNYLAINSVIITDGDTGEKSEHVNLNYFVVSVEFSYTEEYAITDLKITCDCYTSDAGSNLAGDLDMDNIDLEYAKETGKVELLDGAVADTYTFTVEQAVGERTFVNEYDKEYFTPKSFLVYSDETFTTLCPNTVTVSLTIPEEESAAWVRFYLADTNGMKFTSGEGVTWTSSDNDGLSVFSIFSTQSSQVRFMAKAVGTYTVTISYAGVDQTFTVIVTE